MIDPESKRYQFKEWWNGPFKTDATKGEPRIIKFEIKPDHVFILSCDGKGRVVLQQQCAGSYSVNFWNGKGMIDDTSQKINSDNSPSPSGSLLYEMYHEMDKGCYFDYNSDLKLYGKKRRKKRIKMNLKRVKDAQARFGNLKPFQLFGIDDKYQDENGKLFEAA
eukprot:298026_1